MKSDTTFLFVSIEMNCWRQKKKRIKYRGRVLYSNIKASSKVLCGKYLVIELGGWKRTLNNTE